MKKFRLSGLFVFLGLVAFTGCNKEQNESPKAHGKPEKVSHEHGTGPHGGTVFDFGRWHAEFTVSHKDQEATVYILVSDEKTRTAIPTSPSSRRTARRRPRTSRRWASLPANGST